MSFCDRLIGILQHIQELPNDHEQRQGWLRNDDGKTFVQSLAGGESAILASAKGIFVCAVLVPTREFSRVADEEALDWELDISCGWGISYTSKGGKFCEFKLNPPRLCRMGAMSLAEPIFTTRSFEGYPRDEKQYEDFNPKLIQSAGIHWVKDRSAYSELDEQGDFVDRIRILKSGRVKVISGDHCVLDPYLYLTKSTMVQLFEINRADDRSSSSREHTSRESRIIGDRTEGFLARHTVWFDRDRRAVASILRGVQVVRPFYSRKEAMKIVAGERSKRQYEEFLILDLESNEVKKWTADPKRHGNYHVESDFPLSMSPVFFKSEVLRKYQVDSEKYELKGRQISCRGGWTLRTYDINEQGQVHTYLCYLGDLPYAEQKYWALFNEAPKGEISKRSFETDFLGKFPSEIDPMQVLQATLRDFPSINVTGQQLVIWVPKLGTIEETFRAVHQVVTESKNEWTEFMRAMAVAVVEGFQIQALRRLAASLDCGDPNLGTLKLLRNCLLKKGVDEDVVTGILAPLIDLQVLKSGVASHGGASLPSGSLREDAHRRLVAIAGGCEGLRRLVEQSWLDS